MNISYYNGVNDLIIHSIFFTFVYINMKSIDIHINSNDRTSGTNENFSTNLFLPINNIKNIKNFFNIGFDNEIRHSFKAYRR